MDGLEDEAEDVDYDISMALIEKKQLLERISAVCVDNGIRARRDSLQYTDDIYKLDAFVF